MTSSAGASSGGGGTTLVRTAIFAALAAVCLASCASPPVTPPRDTRRTVLSLQDLTCTGCAERLATDLQRQPGVESARFDPEDEEIVVLANPAFDALRA